MPATPAPPPGLTPVLLARIRAELAAHGVRTVRLVEGDPCLNLNASDRSRVFVKVSRAGERTTRPEAELCGAAWAHGHGLAAPRPLLDRVLDVPDEAGDLRAVTVWPWLEAATPPALHDQARLACDLLARIRAVPAPEGARDFDLGWFTDRIHTRLDGRDDPEATRLVRTADRLTAQAAPRLDPARYTWLHGDLHFHNLRWGVSGSPVLLDWESHTRGPVEWEVAQVVRSTHIDFPGHTASEQARTRAMMRHRLDAALGATSVGIDWVLVDLFGRFRAASAASHRLLHGHAPDKQRLDLRLASATSLWDPLPGPHPGPPVGTGVTGPSAGV